MLVAADSTVPRKYIPELDAFRALAVFTVLLSHGLGAKSDFSLLRTATEYGNLGVQLFFVLSGYLITGILLKAKGGDRYFTRFYARRGLRIWPIYYLVVLVAAVASGYLKQFVTLDMPVRWWTYIIYIQNLYYGHHEQPFPLGPTWTLAVEEQFYLVWPLLVFLVSRKNLVRIAVFLIVAVPILRATQVLDTWNTLCQLDALAIGALFAAQRSLVEWKKPAWIGLWLLPLGIYLQATQRFGWSHAVALPKLLQIYGAAALLLLALDNTSIVAVFLKNKPLQYLGKISYGLYLYSAGIFGVANSISRHYGLVVEHASLIVQLAVFVLKSCVLIVVASLSYHLIEMRFLSLKRYFDAPPETLPTVTVAESI